MFWTTICQHEIEHDGQIYTIVERIPSQMPVPNGFQRFIVNVVFHVTVAEGIALDVPRTFPVKADNMEELARVFAVTLGAATPRLEEEAKQKAAAEIASNLQLQQAIAKAKMKSGQGIVVPGSGTMPASAIPVGNHGNTRQDRRGH